jgi:D-arabinose 1-dehydrogenase-like Zn-dependent alcohol dehydrogenase
MGSTLVPMKSYSGMYESEVCCFGFTVLIVGTLLGTTKDAAEMFDIFVKNKLKVIKTVFTLDQVNELVKAYESGSVAGKLVVKV